MMASINWIFFDLGWTLVDETEAHRARLESMQQYLAEFGRVHSVDELMKMCESAATDFAPSPFQGMLARLNLPDEQAAEVARSVHYGKDNEVLYAGVPELLAKLSERFKIGVIANQSDGTEERLECWGIRSYFSIVFASAELGLSKPDPRIFASALAEAGCSPQKALMVGDRIDNDIRPAKSQGWNAVRVLQGFSRFQEPRGPQEIPDITISTVQELSDSDFLQAAT